jgi:peptidoglycan/xylan/chitin deacetylase (PgdA/CDA1 family)
MKILNHRKIILITSFLAAQNLLGWGLLPSEAAVRTPAVSTAPEPVVQTPYAILDEPQASEVKRAPVAENPPLEQPSREAVPKELETAILPQKVTIQSEAEEGVVPKVKLPAGYSKEAITQLLKQNKGQLAPEEKQLYTTAQAVPFTFTGFSRKESVDAVLRALQEIGGRGTFFITEGEMQKYPQTLQAVIDAGQEVGICIYPRKSENMADILADILRTRQELQARGVDTRLVRQFSGTILPETREAVAAAGFRLIGNTVNAVQSRHKDYTSPEKILSEIYGPGVRSATRGGIVQIRMDWYTKPDLAAELLLYLKQKKIDNMAYNGFGDVSGVNPDNDSAYRITSVGDILADKTHLWQYPVPEKDWLPQLKRHPLLQPGVTHDQLIQELSKRYIGEPTVKEDRSIGLDVKDFQKLDLTGNVKTSEPVVFFTFDDWGYDDSINKVLYVLRKHHVPGTFFVLTHNEIYNPNLLRAIAQQGNDIGSHTNLHKPMATEDSHHKEKPTESYEEFYRDVDTSYRRLESTLGDMHWKNGRPVLTKMLRPPTLALSAMGTRAILENGFEYIVNGHTSTEDYAAPSLVEELQRIRDGLYYHGKVRNGAVFVMHMTSGARYTPIALDVLLTENEKKPDGNPTKFKVGLLSDYLRDGYSQAKSEKQLREEKNQIKWW